MKSGLKRSAQSPPAPSPCAAPERLSFADCRNSLSTLNPASRGVFVSFVTRVPRRNMFRDLILRGVGARVGRKISGAGIGGGLDLDACSDEGFTEHRFCELCGRWYGY